MKTKINNKNMGPLHIIFIPHKKDDGFNISSNGEGYPTIKETEKALKSLTLFLKEIKKRGQKELDKINKGIYKRREEEQMYMNNMHSQSTKSTKEEKTQGCVYILKSKNLYKIGKALNPKNRLRRYITENPFGIKLIYQKLVNNYNKVEKELLDVFKNKNYRGEWFKLNKDDIKRVKEIINKGEKKWKIK